jgi:uncharacterized protein with von Willebrand factor type A (vWA) domain
MDDAFFQHYGYDEPKVRSQDQMDSSRYVNRLIAEKMSRAEDLRNMRPTTRNKPLESVIATIAQSQSFRESYENELAEHGQRATAMDEAEQELSAIDDALESLRACMQEPDSQDDIDINTRNARELGQQKRDTVERLKELQNQQAQAAPAIAGDVQKAIGKAIAAGHEAVEQAKEIPGIGLGKAPGMGSQLAPDVMFDLAARYMSSPILKAVADMLGRVLPSMRTSRRTKRKGGVEEIVDIELGNNLPVVLPGELIKLCHPVLRLDFFRRMMEEQLYQYEIWSTEDLKKGPMIFVVDESQSMDFAKRTWAKATAIAMGLMANREGRPVAFVSFSGTGQVNAWVFPKGRSLDPVAIADFAEHHFNGGTSTYSGLEQAEAIMKESAPFHNADLVVCTDGEDRWTPADEELRDEFRGMGVKIHGIAVGIGPTQYLLNLCDHSTSVMEYGGKNETNDRLAITMT